MSGVITQLVYMGVGSSGAMTNVSTYVDLVAGIDYEYGRSSEFDDTAPGTFSFTLDNADGRFTPDNTSSPYATTVTEGMVVCWSAGARLVRGTIIGIEPAFPGDDAAWSQIVITCDDMLGDLARTELSGCLADDAVFAATPYAYWPMSDATGSIATEALGGAQPDMVPLDGDTINVASFGYAGLPGASTTQAYFTGNDTNTTFRLRAGTDTFAAVDYPSGSLGAWGFWLTPERLTLESLSSWFGATFLYEEAAVTFSIASSGADILLRGEAGNGSTVTVATLREGVTQFIAVVVTNTSTTMTATFYLDGVSVASSTGTGLSFTTAADKQLRRVDISHQDDNGVSTGFYLYGLSHTADRVVGESVTLTTESGRALAIVAACSSAAITTPSGLSEALVAAPNPDGSALDALNAVVKAEQGYVYTATSGSVSSPSEAIVFRGRDRPTAVSESFDVEDEGSGAPVIVRDVTYLVSAVSVVGPEVTVRVSDADIRTTASSSEDVALADRIYLTGWGQDRLIRGANTQLRVEAVTIDAFTTPTARSADLLALVPGDRIQITDMPSTVLGFSTWDGWLIGASERHGLGVHEFMLKLQPVLDDPSIYDTDRFASDGALTLNAGINSSVTSVVYATTGPEFASTTLPVSIIIDSEQMSVTACNTGTNTLTVTRGQGGTTAASHSAAAEIELVTPATYAF